MAQTLKCWNCGESLDEVPRPISRHANCDHCFEVLHCCRMCRHYDPERRPYCDDDRADPPQVKENANFCDFFSPANRFETSRATNKDHAKSKLDSLFDADQDIADESFSDEDEDPMEQHRDDPRSKLDDLFGD